MRHHSDSEIEASPERAAVLREIKESFYMDNIRRTCDSVKEGKESVKLVSEAFNRGHFFLAKWNSNSEEIADFIENQGIADCVVR